MIVAGFELMTIVRKPSSGTPFSACGPAWSNSQAWPMTIGPEPIRQIERRSRRLGKRHLLDPLAEQRARVVRARPRLGMELHRGCGQLRKVEALDGAVVQRDVRGGRPRAWRDREAVVLARDEHL